MGPAEGRLGDAAQMGRQDHPPLDLRRQGHQGMVRRAEQTQRIWLGQESGEMTFFVYDYTLDG